VETTGIGRLISRRPPYKELTCKLGVWKIRREARRPGSLLWAEGGPRREPPVSGTPVTIDGARSA
jgi:hypothetical protein